MDKLELRNTAVKLIMEIVVADRREMGLGACWEDWLLDLVAFLLWNLTRLCVMEIDVSSRCAGS